MARQITTYDHSFKLFVPLLSAFGFSPFEVTNFFAMEFEYIEVRVFTSITDEIALRPRVNFANYLPCFNLQFVFGLFHC